MRFFFFGTLLDADVRRIVLGRPLPRAQIAPASIGGFRRVTAAGFAFPILVPDRAGTVPGILVDGLTRADAARLRYFESGYRAVARTVRLADGTPARALVFLATTHKEGAPDWSLAAWRRRGKRAFLTLSRKVMAGYRQAKANG